MEEDEQGQEGPAGEEGEQQLPYKQYLLPLSVFFTHTLAYTYFTEDSQPTCPLAVVL